MLCRVPRVFVNTGMLLLEPETRSGPDAFGQEFPRLKSRGAPCRRESNTVILLPGLTGPSMRGVVKSKHNLDRTFLNRASELADFLPIRD